MINVENEELKISVNPLGAELSSVILKATGREYIWQGDPAVWSGHAPVLFPICGRLCKDAYFVDGERYSMPKHGFARRREFDTLYVEQSCAAFVLRSDAKTKISYPFDFELGVKFSLDENKLKTTYSVINTGEAEMYFSLGAHPAFGVDIGGRVEFPIKGKAETLTVNSDGLIDGARTLFEDGDGVTITENVFDEDAIIIPSPSFSSVKVVSPSGEAFVNMTFGRVPYLLLWSKPGAPFVCVEPWYGIPDEVGAPTEISAKKSVLSLSIGERFDFETEIEFLRSE